jgi:hypothetical protein
MYEYQIRHKTTNKNTIIFGYNYADACRRWKIEPEEWTIELQEYID